MSTLAWTCGLTCDKSMLTRGEHGTQVDNPGSPHAQHALRPSPSTGGASGTRVGAHRLLLVKQIHGREALAFEHG